MTDRKIVEDVALSADFETEAAGAPAPAVAPRWIQQQQRPETELDRIRAQQAMMQQQQL